MSYKEPINYPTRAPDLEGPYGKAWKHHVVLDATTPKDWLVEAPGRHPLWKFWRMDVISLRPIEGQSRPPVIRREGATHEFMWFILDPEKALPPVDGRGSIGIVTPFDLEHQVVADSDAQVADTLKKCVWAVVQLGWSPDSDFRQMWMNSLEQTIEHARLGGHPGPEVH